MTTPGGEEGSTLPPSQRDLTDLEAFIRTQGRNDRLLGQGFTTGRMVTPRAVTDTSESEDDTTATDGGETADDTQYEWVWDDRHLVTGGGGTQVATLSFTPVDESLFVRWHPDGGAGVPIINEDFTLDGNIVTIADPGIFAAGDFFSFQYQMDPGFEDAPDDGSLYDAAVMARPGLLGFWRHAESGGLVMEDSSGLGHHGTYSADVVLGASALLTGDPDTTAHFPPAATAPYGVVPYGAWMDVATFTVETWMATDALSPGILALVNRDTNARSWIHRVDSGGNSRFEKIQGGVVSSVQTTDLDDTIRHMVAATYDGSFIRQYVDGVLIGSPVACTGNMSTAADMGFGGTYAGSGTWWPVFFMKGRMSKSAYYSGAESAAEILNRWTIGSTGAP